jgi:hypothetical protein
MIIEAWCHAIDALSAAIVAVVFGILAWRARR